MSRPGPPSVLRTLWRGGFVVPAPFGLPETPPRLGQLTDERAERFLFRADVELIRVPRERFGRVVRNRGAMRPARVEEHEQAVGTKRDDLHQGARMARLLGVIRLLVIGFGVVDH